MSETGRAAQTETALILRCLGFGFWQAWSIVVYSDNFLNERGSFFSLFGDVEQTYTSTLMTVSLIGIIVVVIVIPLFKRADQWILSRWFSVACGIVMGAATLVVCWFAAGSLPLSAAFFCAAFLTGAGSGLVCLSYGPLLGAFPPRRSLPLTCLCMIICCAIYFMALTMPFELKCALSAALPAFAGLLPALGRSRDADLARDATQRISLSRSALRFFISMAIIGGAATFIRGPLLISPAAEQSGIVWNGTGTLAVIAVCAALMVHFALHYREEQAGGLYYPIGMLTIAFLIFALIGSENGNVVLSSLLAELSSVPRLLLNVVLDAITFCIIFRSKMSPAKIMGLSHGFKSIGILVGCVLGFAFISTTESRITLCALVALCVVAALVLVSPARVLASTMISIEDDDAERTGGDRGEACEKAASVPNDGNGGEGDVKPQRKGLWHKRCDAVCRQFLLSPREGEVLYLISLGHGSEYIAKELSISLHTARTHTRNIYSKIDVHSREELIHLVKYTQVDESR